MNCRNARQLLNQGVIPGSLDAQRATLGFHLSGCAACRMYRRDMEDLRVLNALLAQPLCAPQARASAAWRRPTSRPLRMAGAALLVGGALAMLPATGILSTAVTEARPATLTSSEVRRDDVFLATARTNHARAAERENMALLQSLLEEKLTLRQARTAYTHETRIARAGLAPGLEITIPALPIASNEAAPQQQATTTYTVVPGDSLWLISQKIWGDGRYWELIYTANKTIIANPNLIYPNQKFTIPYNLALPLNTVPVSNPVTTPIQNPIAAGNYTIVRGDTLSHIALRRYGDASRWPEIHTRNQTAIGANPHLIYPGTVLNLP